MLWPMRSEKAKIAAAPELNSNIVAITLVAAPTGMWCRGTLIPSMVDPARPGGSSFQTGIQTELITASAQSIPFEPRSRPAMGRMMLIPEDKSTKTPVETANARSGEPVRAAAVFAAALNSPRAKPAAERDAASKTYRRVVEDNTCAAMSNKLAKTASRVRDTALIRGDTPNIVRARDKVSQNARMLA
jgi:hypothetical protein